MKTKKNKFYKHFIVIAGVLWTAACVCAQDSLFTYQGRLQENGLAANGVYDLSFQLYDASSGGNPVALTQEVAGQTVEAGLFTVALDFGSGIFNGSPRWLQIAARKTGENVWESLV